MLQLHQPPPELPDCVKYSFSRNPRLKKLWQGIKQRCCNEKATGYRFYGARGITICGLWRDNFIEFAKWSLNNGYKDDLTIDRIDAKGHYEPSNCQWITGSENSSKDAPKVLFKDRWISMREACELANIHRTTLYLRLKSGWSIKKAIETGRIRAKSKY